MKLDWVRTKVVRVFDRLLLPFFQRRLKQDVIIFVNIGNRDVLGLFWVYCLLKYKYGIKVKIFSVTTLKDYWVRLYRPNIVVHVMIDCKAAIEMYERMKALGCSMVVSPTEVVAWTGVGNFIFRSEYKHLIEGMLLSGKEMADFLVKAKKISNKQAILVGYPTLDWTKKPLSNLFLSKSAFRKIFGIKSQQKVLFLASSFSMADFDLENWDEKKSVWNLSKSEIKKMINASKKMRVKTVECFKEMLKENQTYHVIVKKHPLEMKGFYEKEFESFENVSVVNEMDIHDLLKNSDVLIHWNSTTSIQAWGFNLPTVLLDFKEGNELIGFQKGILDEFQSGNYRAVDYKSLVESIKSSLSEKKTPRSQIRARKQYVSEWFGQIDGKNGERVAEEISNLLGQTKNNTIAFDLGLHRLVYYLPRLLSYKVKWLAYSILRPFLGSENKLLNDISQKYDKFYLQRHRRRFETQLQDWLGSK